MHLLSRAIAIAVVLGSAFASTALGQRRSDAGVQPLSRRGAAPAVAQQPAAPMTGPEWAGFAGIASGDGAYDLGFVLGGTGRWNRADWPVTARGDAYLARHGGGTDFAGVDYDASVLFLGALGSVEYVFPGTSQLKPYVFGGLGLFYSRYSVDYDGGPFGGDDSFDDSGLELGIGLGGGLQFTPRFGAELRVMDIGGFTTIPIVAVLRF